MDYSIDKVKVRIADVEEKTVQTGEELFHAERTACVKALGQKRAFQVQESGGRSVCLELQT